MASCCRCKLFCNNDWFYFSNVNFELSMKEIATQLVLFYSFICISLIMFLRNQIIHNIGMQCLIFPSPQLLSRVRNIVNREKRICKWFRRPSNEENQPAITVPGLPQNDELWLLCVGGHSHQKFFATYLEKNMLTRRIRWRMTLKRPILICGEHCLAWTKFSPLEDKIHSENVNGRSAKHTLKILLKSKKVIVYS